MSEVVALSKTRFCWVKAVMQAPSCDVVSQSEQPWTLPCSREAGVMPPPPAPLDLVNAIGATSVSGFVGPKYSTLGAGTPPPEQAMAPRFPASVASSADPTGGQDFWRMASFAPGAALSDGAPVVTLIFMPIIGSRAEVKAWRLQNPSWFKDAVAVTLLSYES